MSQARIFRPAKNAMQSGRGQSKAWVLEYEPSDRKTPDPLMGWNGSRDTLSQLRLKFDSKEAAIAFAQREGIEAEVIEPAPVVPSKPKNYSDNFSFYRIT